MPVTVTHDQRLKAIRIYAAALPLIAEAVGIDAKALHNIVLRKALYGELRNTQIGEASPLAEPVAEEVAPQRASSAPIQPEKPMLTSRLKPEAIEPVAGGQVYLKNKATGAYLHMSGEIMTMDKAQRWKGTPTQALACKRKFDLAASLSMVRAMLPLPQQRENF